MRADTASAIGKMVPRSLRFLFLAAVLIMVPGLAISASGDETRHRTATALSADKGTVLVVVNGDSITATDLDLALIRTHQAMTADARKGFDYTRILNKLINDQLLMQEAESIDMDTEPEIAGRIAKALSDASVRAYVAGKFSAPDSVPEADVRDYFNRYYWRITFSQLSTPTRGEAEKASRAIRGGAPMDSLARSISTDAARYKGGLHNRELWADIDLSVRPILEGLKPGRLSDPFPFVGNSWSIVRLEKRFPVEERDYLNNRVALRGFLTEGKRKEAWKAFVKARGEEFPVSVDEAAIARILADSSQVFNGSFRNDAPGPALEIDSKHMMTEGELRTEISHAAMESGTTPFRSILGTALDKAKEELILPAAAERAGYARDPDVLAESSVDRKDILVQSYLNETIVPKIRFSHAEFRDYYDKHREDFRGPDEVQLGDMILKDKAQADSVAKALHAGADFDYMKRQLRIPVDASDPKWTAIDFFSDAVRSQIKGVKVGGTTDPLPVADGWVIWKLLGRRKGQVQTLDQADVQIRQVMFQKKFNALLDDQLKKIKAHSKIRRDEAAIAQYFRGGK